MLQLYWICKKLLYCYDMYPLMLPRDLDIHVSQRLYFCIFLMLQKKRTAVHLAVNKMHYSTLQYLVEEIGLDPNLPDSVIIISVNKKLDVCLHVVKLCQMKINP